MRRIATLMTFLVVTAMTASAFAQPRALRRRRGPPTKPPGQAKKEDPNANRNAQVCQSRRAILSQEQQRRDAYATDLAGIDSEITQLRRQLEQLARQRTDTKRLVDVHNRRVAEAEKRYKKDCNADENCGQYETLAGRVETDGARVQSQLDNVRNEMVATRRESDGLRSRIDPLRREYQNLRCNNMVPGETAQSTIDRCSAIFSDWNRQQADLNNMNRRLSQLKGRYEQLLAELRSIEGRAQSYETYMATNCRGSAKVTAMRDYGRHGGVRKRAEDLGKELDKLIDDVTTLRGVRITVEGR